MNQATESSNNVLLFTAEKQGLCCTLWIMDVPIVSMAMKGSTSHIALGSVLVSFFPLRVSIGSALMSTSLQA